jgi:thiol:disulfide interchange protein
LILTILVSVSAMAQSEPEVIAVINKADWCGVCKANGPRAMEVFMKNNTDGAIKFISNDLTNDQSKKESAVALKKVGLDQVIEKYRGTGQVLFFHSQNKTLINRVSLCEPDSKLLAVMVLAKKDIQ